LTPCTTDVDCEVAGACPVAASLGCKCFAPPMPPDAQKNCVPACTTKSDCPAGSGMELDCSPEGLCIPSGPPQ
jgi:hypothetical protein